MLACDRHIPDNVISLREGKWNKKEFSVAKGLYGRTLGVIGFGNIAQEVVKRGRAFGMNIAVNSRWMTPEIAAEIGVTQAKTPEELASLSDFVSVHIALNPQTKGLLGKAFFNAMRPGTIFINTSRAEVVDQAAMVTALAEKNLKAGLDVFEDEPTVAQGEYTGSLKDNPHVYTTHHIGASTDQAQDAVAAETVRIVKEFKNTGLVPNVVNVAKGETATHLLIVRHADKVGVLAGVLEALKREGVSVQEMENIIMGGAKAAIAQISTDKEPSANVILAIKKNADIFDAHAIPLPKH
jgi:D-3-phosphoglycerate dehydrogenase